MSDTQYWKRTLPSDFRLVIPLGVRAVLLGENPLDLISGEEVLFSEGAPEFPPGGYTDTLAKWDKPDAHLQLYERGETFAILLTNKPVWVEPEHRVPDDPLSGYSVERCWTGLPYPIYNCSIKDCSVVDEGFWDAPSKPPYTNHRSKTLLQDLDFAEMELRLLASLGVPVKWLTDFLRPPQKETDIILSLNQPKENSLEKLELKYLKRREPAPAAGVFSWPPLFFGLEAEGAVLSNAEQVASRMDRTDTGRMCSTRPEPFHRLPPPKNAISISELYKAPWMNIRT